MILDGKELREELLASYKNIIEKVSKAMHSSFKKKNINSVIKVLNIPTKGIIIN